MTRCQPSSGMSSTGPDCEHADVVHHQIHTSEPLERHVTRCREVIDVRHIAAGGNGCASDVGGDVVRPLLVEICDHHLGASAGERMSGRLTDPTSRTRQHGHTSGQIKRHRSLLEDTQTSSVRWNTLGFIASSAATDALDTGASRYATVQSRRFASSSAKGSTGHRRRSRLLPLRASLDNERHRLIESVAAQRLVDLRDTTAQVIGELALRGHESLRQVPEGFATVQRETQRTSCTCCRRARSARAPHRSGTRAIRADPSVGARR